MKKIMMLCSLLAAFACTKKQISTTQVQKTETLQFESPIKFIYDKTLVGTGNAAQIGDDPISRSQLVSPAPALRELIEKSDEYVLVMAYGLAVAQASQKKNPQESVTVKVSFAEPQMTVKKKQVSKLKDMLRFHRVEAHKGVELEYDQELPFQTAMVGGESITYDSLAKANLAFAKNRMRVFNQSLRQLEGVVSRRLVLMEAKKQEGVTAEQFIQDTVLGGAITVSEEEALQYAAENNVSEKDLNEIFIKRLKDIIKGKTRERKITEYVAANLLSGPVKVAFDRPGVQVEPPKLSDAVPHRGNGKINITLFSNFTCEDCKEIESNLDDLIKKESQHFRLNYLFQFQGREREARMISEAALCVKKQGDGLFWDFQKARLAGTLTAEETKINETVQAMGANYDDFKTCFLSREFKDSVESHLKHGRKLGFFRAPVVLVEGKVFEGRAALPDVVAEVERIKAEKGLTSVMSKLSLWQKIKNFFFAK